MVRIVADTSTMYSSQQAKEAGFAVSPLAVTIAGETYRELDEMDGNRFVEIIHQGNMPRSSQPALGDVLDVYAACGDDEVLNIAMADGLSGTYSTAVTAAEASPNKERITVLNSGTLCGPHRHLVETAVKLARQGLGVADIRAKLEALMQTERSFLIPSDFDYLRRGGRLSPLVSYVGKAIKLAPVLTLSADRRQLVMSGVKRSFKQAVAHVSKELTAHGAGEGWRIYVTHAAVPEMAQAAPFGIPPAPRIRVRAQGDDPTGASQGRAATDWVLSLLVRGLAAPPPLHMHRQRK